MAPKRAQEGLSADLVDLRIQRLRDERSGAKRRMWWAATVAGCLLVAASFVPGVLRNGAMAIAFDLVPITALVIAAPGRVRMAAKRLSEVDDVRAIGPLALALASDVTDRSLLMRRLTALLPRLKASDAEVLSAQHRAALCRAIEVIARRGAYARERDFIVAALGALAQGGGEESLPCVQALAVSQPRDTYEERIVEAAQACLPALAQRSEQQRVAMTLLRPAGAPVDGADVLLRPAGGPSPTDTDLLLRPSQGALPVGGTVALLTRPFRDAPPS